jgi:hypothetical protein
VPGSRRGAAHPDQRPEYAAKQAVAIILAAKVSLRVDDA